jgi:hypothetical protein
MDAAADQPPGIGRHPLPGQFALHGVDPLIFLEAHLRADRAQGRGLVLCRGARVALGRAVVDKPTVRPGKPAGIVIAGSSPGFPCRTVNLPTSATSVAAFFARRSNSAAAAMLSRISINRPIRRVASMTASALGSPTKTRALRISGSRGRDDAPECSCVIDCSGLYEIAATRSDNLKSLYLDHLKKGIIAVPACVWREFQKLYDEEAAALAPYVTIKINMKRAYYVGAATITEKLNAGFSRGAYDSHTDLYTASIASIEGYLVLTSSSQSSYYTGMDCEVLDLAAWAEQVDRPLR